jgi:hypothetical protein
LPTAAVAAVPTSAPNRQSEDGSLSGHPSRSAGPAAALASAALVAVAEEVTEEPAEPAVVSEEWVLRSQSPDLLKTAVQACPRAVIVVGTVPYSVANARDRLSPGRRPGATLAAT